MPGRPPSPHQARPPCLSPLLIHRPPRLPPLPTFDRIVCRPQRMDGEHSHATDEEDSQLHLTESKGVLCDQVLCDQEACEQCQGFDLIDFEKEPCILIM